ncbi:MAG: alpha/beta hydrolase [Candidatus Thiodiazotropha sp.]
MRFVLSLLLSLLPCAASAEETSMAFDDDSWASDTEAVNEGELEFLDTPPAEPVHHHINRIQIGVDSLRDGWVDLHQCHRHLDPVPLLEIVYHPRRIRRIELLSMENIGSGQVEGSSIVLRDIQRHASICLQAESRSLHILGGDRYQLRNGPYMRKFLDGYYPMRLTLEVDYPADLLDYTALRPLPLDAGRPPPKQGNLYWDGWFQGRLYTEIEFRTSSTDR